ncbi:hypothetical protein D3C85_1023900 [compost metagenome]
MGVLLGFGNAQLRFPKSGQVFPQAVVNSFGRECTQATQLFGILRQCQQAILVHHKRPLEGREIRLDQRLGQLPRPIGAKVHEDHGVIRTDTDGLPNRGWLDEFVRLPTFVSGRQSYRRRFSLMFGFAANNQAVGRFHAPPAVVAIHCIVATDQRNNASGAQSRKRVFQSLKRG